MLTISLFDPQIPPNTGNIARLCGANNIKLDLVGDLGFDIDDRYLKRAGLDYWDYINYEIFPDINDYIIKKFHNNFHLLTTKSNMPYTKRKFKPDDYLVFGSEISGISNHILERYSDHSCTIPMISKNIRSLNLATSVGIVLYEALRQING